MPWTSPAKEAMYGVVIYNFWPKSPDDSTKLSLSIGDVVHITDEMEGWFHGYKVKKKSEKGIFPRNYVHIRENVILEKGTGELVYLSEPAIVQEITAVVQEWAIILKDLYITDAKTFLELRKILLDLIDKRKLIMAKILTADELKALQSELTSKIDLGNMLLGLDLVLRDEDAHQVNPAQIGCIQMFRMHNEAAEKIMRARSVDIRRSSGGPQRRDFCLFVCVRNFVCKIGEDADVLISLYDAKSCNYISESYVVKWGSQGLPKDLESINNLRVLFTDFGNRELSRDKIYLVCRIFRIGRMDLKDSDTKKQTLGLKRPFGAAAMDVTEIMRGTINPDPDKQYFIPVQQSGEEFMDQALKKVLQARDINHRGQGLWVSLEKLPGDISTVQEDFPHLVLGTVALARKMGFPDVFMPGDIRNDLYVTLVSGEFSKGGKTTDKNVEVVVKVCDEKGKVIPDVISEGVGSPLFTEYKSAIYYHEDKPKWCEPIKLALPVDLNNIHIKFMFKHRSTSEAKDKVEKPYAIAYFKPRKQNGTTITDGTHDLLVYKVEGKRVDSSAYLSLPSTRQELELRGVGGAGSTNKLQILAGPLSLLPKDSFQISTMFVSTKLTHSADLLYNLNWRDNVNNLKQHLENLLKVDGEEIVKFLQDTLDALFNILMHHSESDHYDYQVFDALVFIIGLVERKYFHFRPVLDNYIQNEFSATLAYNKLITVLKYYVDMAEDPDCRYRDALLGALKSLEYLFKFIVRSRILFAALNDGRGKQHFEMTFRQLFHSLTTMMMCTSDPTVLQQGAALKYLPAAIPDLMTVIEPRELSVLLVEFIEKIPPDRLVKQKLQSIEQIVHCKIFLDPDCRAVLLPMVVAQLNELLPSGEELELCVKILSDILYMFYNQDMGPVYDDMLLILTSLLRPVIRLDREGSVQKECAAVLTAMLNQMGEAHYDAFVDSFPSRRDLVDVLMEILLNIQCMVNELVYPPDWNEMIMLQNSIFLKVLRFVAKTMQTRLLNPFESQLWNNYFHCSIAFLTQPSLQLHDFSALKRSKIESRYGDMRREMANEITTIWYTLSEEYRIKFIPGMVGPILEMALIQDKELRKSTIPLFFDMMRCEFHMNGSFFEVENELVSQLDVQFESGRGDDEFMDLFFIILYKKLDKDEDMKEAGLDFVEMIRKLLKRLLEYRTVINDENKDKRMACIVNLLTFFHEINRREMYIRYLNKLCFLHLDCDNYTEAAHTLQRYTNLLQWSDQKLSSILLSPAHPEMVTHRELKEQLTRDIIDYFDKGKMWEKGIELCKELAYQFEHETFDYIELSRLLEKESQFYKNIMGPSSRPSVEYFRVGFYGVGFPPFLQNKVYVYRGNEYERLGDFRMRMLTRFADAEEMTSLDAPNEQLQESDGQYLQIVSVTPVMKETNMFTGKNVREQILRYYRTNEVNKFQYSRPIEDPSEDVASLWLERFTLTTVSPLPGILKFSEVSLVEVNKVSPLENAVETVEQANQRLKSLIEQHYYSPGERIDPLSMLLNGIIDPAVNGGLNKYKLFYSDDYMKEHSSDRQIVQLIRRLKTATEHQALLLYKGLCVHCRKTPSQLIPFHEHMVSCYEDMKNLLERDFGIKVKLQDTNLKRARTFSVSTTNQERPASTMTSVDTPVKNSPSAQRNQSVYVKPGTGSLRRSSSPNKTTSRLKLPNMPTFSRRPLSIELKEKDEHSSKAGTNSPTQGGSKIELTEQLICQRPKRPDQEKRHSRPPSQQLKMGSLTPLDISLDDPPSPLSNGSFDISPLREKPPPLPQKLSCSDYMNLNDLPEGPPPLPYRESYVPKRPVPPLPSDGEVELRQKRVEPPASPQGSPPPLPVKNFKRSSQQSSGSQGSGSQ